MYCKKCKIVFEADRCPICGNKKLQAPQPDDLCFLTEVDQIWSGMLEDVLQQNEIPNLKQSTMGAGMALKAGSMLERIRFYVRYEDFSKAAEIVEELFPSSDVSACEDCV